AKMARSTRREVAHDRHVIHLSRAGNLRVPAPRTAHFCSKAAGSIARPDSSRPKRSLTFCAGHRRSTTPQRNGSPRGRAGCGAAPGGAAPHVLLLLAGRADYPRPMAERKPSRNWVPLAHVAGRAVSTADALHSDCPRAAVGCARSRNLTTWPVPLGVSSAIQYVWPAVTEAPVTATLLFAPAVGAEIVPLVSSVCGLLVAGLLL